MSKERELLRRVKVLLECSNMEPLQRQTDLIVGEIKELLAQPESTAEAIMPNGVCVSNVYAAYEEGRKSVMSEQEPVAWKDRTYGNLHHVDYGNSIPLYISPPKREPLSEATINYYLERLGSSFKWDDGFKAGVNWAEKARGIGGGE